jgi:class 3 adenylate cyclase/tetratricopeptide (TPR) repeat protein
MEAGNEKLTELVALNADIVGYSRLMADDFEGTRATVESCRRLVEQEVSAAGGTVSNFVGDNFMAVFGDARNAVQTAIAITEEMEDRNTDVPEPHRVRFRMGLDQGGVAFGGGGYFGDALNIAARIQSLARPGGVSVSGRVYRALDEPALRFLSIGRKKLKNIPEPVEVYEFADLPADGAALAKRRSLALETPTLAVLPIHAEMVDDSVRATAGMIRRDLLHRLARMPQLSVVDATPEPASETPSGKARYMLETGVHQFGDRIRVFATLYDVTTMNVVKSHKWTATVEEMFSLSDTIADEVARAIEIDLVVGEPAGLYWELNDPQAIERIYLGWYHFRTDTREGWSKALRLFEEVKESHPEQPYGFVLSAFAHFVGASNGWVSDPEAALQRAWDQAQIGFDMGDLTGMAKAVQASVLMARGRVEESLQAIDQLVITRPTCDVTFGLEGSVRRYLGQWEKAVDLLDVAMRLTGINKPWYPTVKACSLFIGGRLEQAASIAEEVLEYHPNNLEALLVLAAAQAEMGLERRARATAQLVRERFPNTDLEAWLEANPYQGKEIVDRWRTGLVSAGVIQAA